MPFDIDELCRTKPHAETDDFHTATAMLLEMARTGEQFRIIVLAQWAARLRHHYVKVGTELARHLD